MSSTRLITLAGLTAILLATSACHRHLRHHHRHHTDAGLTAQQATDMPDQIAIVHKG